MVAVLYSLIGSEFSFYGSCADKFFCAFFIYFMNYVDRNLGCRLRTHWHGFSFWSYEIGVLIFCRSTTKKISSIMYLIVHVLWDSFICSEEYLWMELAFTSFWSKSNKSNVNDGKKKSIFILNFQFHPISLQTSNLKLGQRCNLNLH